MVTTIIFIFNHNNLLLPPKTQHKLLAPWWADCGLLKCHSWGFCLYTQSLNAASTMNLPISKPRMKSFLPSSISSTLELTVPTCLGWTGHLPQHPLLSSKRGLHTQSPQVVVKRTDFGVRQHWVQAQFPPYISCVTQCKLLTLSEPSAFSSVK